jgi:hypothetical protein
MRIVSRFARWVILKLPTDYAFAYPPTYITQNYDISLLSYMPDTKQLRQDEAAYLQHEKVVNKMARRIVKHAYGFEKSAIACFSSTSHYSHRYEWGQALSVASKLRQHINLLRDFPKSLPKGHVFPRQTCA